MSSRRTRKSNGHPARANGHPVHGAATPPGQAQQFHLPQRYFDACRLASEGRYEEARRSYRKLQAGVAKANNRLRGLIENDIATLAALEGKLDEAKCGWRAALEADPDCLVAQFEPRPHRGGR